MGLVAPAVLAALGALAIPVIIHLIQREKKTVVQFPSLMFLRRIPYQSVRRRRIRNWPLLLLRLAALALIVAGVRAAVLPAAGAGRRGAERRPRDGHPARYRPTAWDTSAIAGSAREAAARKAIDALGRRRSRLARAVQHRRRRRRPLHGEPQPAVVGARRPPRQGPARRGSRPALKLAASLLAESPLPRREIVLISDFQRRGWEGARAETTSGCPSTRR